MLLQFLLETVTLASCGRASGILLGFIACFAVTELLEWPASVSLSAVVLSVGISAVVGIFFGFYPARHSLYLYPINSLRHE